MIAGNWQIRRFPKLALSILHPKTNNNIYYTQQNTTVFNNTIVYYPFLPLPLELALK